jgi:hypothetical protein
MVCFRPSLHGQEPQEARAPAKAPRTDYTIQVHISGIHINCGSVLHCDNVVYAEAILNGKKVELMGDNVPIIPGDYVARFAKKSHSDDLQLLGQKYEILFPDKTYWSCTVVGFSE